AVGGATIVLPPAGITLSAAIRTLSLCWTLGRGAPPLHAPSAAVSDRILLTRREPSMDQLKELGWAKRWSSQPYVSCCTTSLQELTTLGIKHVENLAIPSVRNDAAFFFTVVGSTRFLPIRAGQLSMVFPCYLLFVLLWIATLD
ncbi:Os10g0446800, partial [Oryza sativa Japonica Group]